LKRNVAEYLELPVSSQVRGGATHPIMVIGNGWYLSCLPSPLQRNKLSVNILSWLRLQCRLISVTNS